jgi:hypothetical protein
VESHLRRAKAVGEVRSDEDGEICRIIVLTALFDTKNKPNGDFDKRKMRQVGGGHILREGIDYLQTYAPTVSGVVVRIFYAITVSVAGAAKTAGGMM